MVHNVSVRADARRNRTLILEAARGLVADAGPDVTMDEIARAAGVAVGTLYRHFPAKEDLVDAVIEDSVERLAGDTEAALARVEGGEVPGPVLARLFADLAARHRVDRVFKQAAGRLDPTAEMADAAPGSAVARATAAICALLAAAQQAGAVRPDVTLVDLTMLLAAVPDGDDERRSRYVDIVLAGLADPAR